MCSRVTLRVSIDSRCKAQNQPITTGYHTILGRRLGSRKLKREDHTLSYVHAYVVKTDIDNKEATVCRRKILFGSFVASKGEERLPRRVMFGEMITGQGHPSGK